VKDGAGLAGGQEEAHKQQQPTKGHPDNLGGMNAGIITGINIISREGYAKRENAKQDEQGFYRFPGHENLL